MSVIHIFIKPIFRAAEKAPPSPAPPTLLCKGVGGSSGFFQPEAVSLVMTLKQCEDQD
jgi:hypothetical protein